MKKTFLKPIAAVAIAGLTMFSCASTNDGYSSTDTTDAGTTTTTTGTADATGTVDDTGVTGTVETTGTVDDAGTTGTYGTTETTETTTETMDNTGTMGTTETDRMNDTGTMTTDTERLSNTNVDYDQLFVDIDNTAQYGVLELARRDPSFSTFVQLVDMAGLAQSFEAAGPLTVFLPTNEAFEEMDRAEYDRLMDPQNRTELIQLINLHVLSTEYDSGQFGTRHVIQAGDGTEIPVTTTATPGNTAVAPGVIFVGGAEIVRPDIDVSNGVVHVVNGIISPEEVTGPAERR